MAAGGKVCGRRREGRRRDKDKERERRGQKEKQTVWLMKATKSKRKKSGRFIFFRLSSFIERFKHFAGFSLFPIQVQYMCLSMVYYVSHSICVCVYACVCACARALVCTATIQFRPTVLLILQYLFVFVRPHYNTLRVYDMKSKCMRALTYGCGLSNARNCALVFLLCMILWLCVCMFVCLCVCAVHACVFKLVQSWI